VKIRTLLFLSLALSRLPPRIPGLRRLDEGRTAGRPASKLDFGDHSLAVGTGNKNGNVEVHEKQVECW